jgi:hypothetical protein
MHRSGGGQAGDDPGGHGRWSKSSRLSWCGWQRRGGLHGVHTSLLRCTRVMLFTLHIYYSIVYYKNAKKQYIGVRFAPSNGRAASRLQGSWDARAFDPSATQKPRDEGRTPNPVSPTRRRRYPLTTHAEDPGCGGKLWVSCLRFGVADDGAMRGWIANTKDLLDSRSVVRFTILFQCTPGSMFGQWRVIHRGRWWRRELVCIQETLTLSGTISTV